MRCGRLLRVLGLLVLVSLVIGKEGLGVPELLRILHPIRPRSVEIQALKIVNNLGQHGTEPCPALLVQYKLATEGTWTFTNVTERDEGKFVLEGLRPAQVYHVRVACKEGQSQGEAHSPGAFSAELRVETPARLSSEAVAGTGHQDPRHQDGNGGGEDEKAGNDLVRDFPPASFLVQDEWAPNTEPSRRLNSSSQVLGVVGSWANLSCDGSGWDVHGEGLRFHWSHQNETLENTYGVHIGREGNRSVLQVLLTSHDLLGDYICLIEEERGELRELLTQITITVKPGRRAPTLRLTPEWINMTSAKFLAGIEEAGKEESGYDLPLIGYVVQYKLACDIGGDWTSANYTPHRDGFSIQNLEPNEGYYIRAALRNTGSVGNFGQYWKIRTSSAVPVKMRTAGESPGSRPAPNLILLAHLLSVSMYIIPIPQN